MIINLKYVLYGFPFLFIFMGMAVGWFLATPSKHDNLDGLKFVTSLGVIGTGLGLYGKFLDLLLPN